MKVTVTLNLNHWVLHTQENDRSRHIVDEKTTKIFELLCICTSCSYNAEPSSTNPSTNTSSVAFLLSLRSHVFCLLKLLQNIVESTS